MPTTKRRKKKVEKTQALSLWFLFTNAFRQRDIDGKKRTKEQEEKTVRACSNAVQSNVDCLSLDLSRTAMA